MVLRLPLFSLLCLLNVNVCRTGDLVLISDVLVPYPETLRPLPCDSFGSPLSRSYQSNNNNPPGPSHCLRSGGMKFLGSLGRPSRMEETA